MNMQERRSSIKKTKSIRLDEKDSGKFITKNDINFITNYKPKLNNEESIYSMSVADDEEQNNTISKLIKLKVEKWKDTRKGKIQDFSSAGKRCSSVAEDDGNIVLETDVIVDDIWRISKENSASYRSNESSDIKRHKFLADFLEELQNPLYFGNTCINKDALKGFKFLNLHDSLSEEIADFCSTFKARGKKIKNNSNTEINASSGDSQIVTTNDSETANSVSADSHITSSNSHDIVKSSHCDVVTQHQIVDPNNQSDHSCSICRTINEKKYQKEFKSREYKICGLNSLSHFCSVNRLFTIDFDFALFDFSKTEYNKTGKKMKESSGQNICNEYSSTKRVEISDKAENVQAVVSNEEGNGKGHHEVTANILLHRLIESWSKGEDNTKNIDTVNQLLTVGANVDSFISWHPVIILSIMAMDMQLIKLVLSKTNFVNVEDGHLRLEFYESPLHTAVKTKSLGIVKVVYGHFNTKNSSKTIFNQCDISCKTAFVLAVELQLHDIVQYFIKQCDEDYTSINELVKITDKNGQSVGHIAAKNGDYELFKSLQLPVNIGDKYHHTPLSIATEAGHFKFVRNIYSSNVLKTMKCCTYQDDMNGPSLLHMACKCSSLKTVKYLLQQKCGPNAEDETHDFRTPIFETLDVDILNELLPHCRKYAKEKSTGLTAFQKILYLDVDLIQITDQTRCKAMATFAQHGVDLDYQLPNGEIMSSAIILSPEHYTSSSRTFYASFSCIPLHNRNLLAVLFENGANPDLLCNRCNVLDSIVDMQMSEEQLNSYETSTFEVFQMLLKHNITPQFFEQEKYLTNLGKYFSLLQWAYDDFRMEYFEHMIGIGCSVHKLKKSTEHLDLVKDKVIPKDYKKYSTSHLEAVIRRIMSVVHKPRSLMTLTKICIRKSLGHRSPETDITKLLLPQVMKQFLSYRYIHAIFNK